MIVQDNAAPNKTFSKSDILYRFILTALAASLLGLLTAHSLKKAFPFQIAWASHLKAGFSHKLLASSLLATSLIFGYLLWKQKSL